MNDDVFECSDGSDCAFRCNQSLTQGMTGLIDIDEMLFAGNR